MRLNFENSLSSVLIITGTALFWLAFFHFNNFLFSKAALSSRAHWIFLPAALRVIFVLLFQGRGAVGLILGAYLTQPHASPADLPAEILLSISSGLAPLVGVVACQQLFKIDDQLAGMSGWHIIALCVASASANALILNSVEFVIGDRLPDLESIAAVFVGDVLGAATVITAISLSLPVVFSLMKRARQL